MLRQLSVAILLLFALQAQAATLIEVKSPEGVVKIYREGSRSHIDNGDGSYVVLDSKAKTMFVVMPAERQVLDMSQLFRMQGKGDKAKPLDVKFKKQGKGPKIAGYDTVSYRYSANGKTCGTILASKKALKDTGLKDTFKMMDRMADNSDAMMQAFNEDPCERADSRFVELGQGIGIPMRTTSADGSVFSEILRIDKKAKLPPNAFKVPADYQVQDFGQMMQQMKEMQKMMMQMQQPG